MATSSKRTDAIPHTSQVCCSPLSPWQATTHPCLHKRNSNSKAGLTQSLGGFLGLGAHNVLFDPSEHLWRVWDLILNMISALLPSCWGFSFVLGHGLSFFGGAQYSPVDVCSAVSCSFRIVTGKDESTSFCSAPLVLVRPNWKHI